MSMKWLMVSKVVVVVVVVTVEVIAVLEVGCTHVNEVADGE